MLKRYIVGIITGIILTGAVVYAANTLMNALNVSYTSEYTEKDNVKEALDELLEESSTISEGKVNVASPVIKGNLIPVKIEDNGTVKATTSSDKTWYNYGKKIWANAVELVSGAKYHKGESDERDYQVGDTIPESDIRSYFVWIPKYKYRLWNVNSDGESTGVEVGPHSIEIEFDTTNTTDVEGVSCATPMTTNGTGNCNNGEWMTHPAFISMNVDGFWVGKFEIGNKLNTTTSAKTAMTSSTVSDIVIKPDYYSWTSTSAIDYFNLLKTYNENLDSHMIKNTEWGAVAYLSHSIYGKDSKININNNMYDSTNYYTKTGYSSRPEMDQHVSPGRWSNKSTYHTPWNTKNGYLASTTGNISGIYDMSGGANEYVAGFRSGVSVSGDAKYYDLYNTSSSSSYENYKHRILGDATGEMGPFFAYKNANGATGYYNLYGDGSWFITSYGVWFNRGGKADDGSSAGTFNFSTDTGVLRKNIGSRIVLSPTNL